MDYGNTIFKLMPSPCLLLKPNMHHCTVVNVNQAYLNATGTKESDLIGKSPFDVFLGNPDDITAIGSVSDVRRSFLAVMRTKKANRMPIQKYDIPVRGLGTFQLKYWEIENIPVLDDKGNVQLIMHTVKDVTEKTLALAEKKELENKYSNFFHLSPLPMWVYDQKSFRFLDVNEAAINHYGYSKVEFLRMTIKEIRPIEEISLLEKTSGHHSENKKMYFPGVFRHIKKNGDIIKVDIYSKPVLVDGKKAKVVVVNDTTDRMKYIRAVEKQNIKLLEIAWIQSHVVRAPLARLMGCANLLALDEEDLDKNKLMEYLLLSANEFDNIIREIVEKAQCININTPSSDTFKNTVNAFKAA